MIRRLTILILIVGCEEEVTEAIIGGSGGCMTDSACNYDASATQDDGSCDFETCDDCYGIPHGVALLDSCGTCDADNTNDCTQDCFGVWGGGDAVTLWGKCYAVEGTTSLGLSNSGLTGEIPSEIGNLTKLTNLNLWGNQLTGSIPVEIGNLTNLTNLYLSYNQLTGSIPVEIGNLTNLTNLWLHNNSLTGEIPPEVCDLIESNNWDSWWSFEDFVLAGNNLTNTCD